VRGSVREGQRARHYLDALCTNTVVVTAADNWTIYRGDWQFSGTQGPDEAHVPFFGAFGAG